MKKLYLFLFFTLFSFVTIAQQRTNSQKIDIAKAILFENKANTRTNDEVLVKTLKENSVLSVIGYEKGPFVVVSNDETIEPVLGYSLTNVSTMDSINPGMLWWLNSVSDVLKVKAIQKQIYTLVAPPSEYPQKCGPIITSVWNQNSPYNNQCPLVKTGSSTRYPTGCVATAISQIMYYWKYPEHGIGEHQYSFQPADGEGRILSANFGETIYNWSQMIDDYSKPYTNAEADAVSTLMLHCGVAVDMGYTADGSGAYSTEACAGLKKYFGYNENMRIYTRSYYSATQWMNMIYEELSNNRPVYYAGADASNGGHAFVLNGYDENGRVLVNWGWGGKENGYYDIALLNPSSYQFSLQQNMIIGFCKPDVDIPYKSQLASATGDLKYSFYGTTTMRASIALTAFDVADAAFSGSVAALLQNVDTKEITVVKQVDGISLNPMLGGTMQGVQISLPSINLSVIPDGTYRLFVGSKSSNDTEWQLVRTIGDNNSSYVIVKNGTDVTSEGSTDDSWTTGLSNIVISTDKANGKYYNLSGVEVNVNYKGILIHNGKKLINK